MWKLFYNNIEIKLEISMIKLYMGASNTNHIFLERMNFAI